MKIKVEPFLMRKGNRVAKAAIEFESQDSFLNGFHLVGFTICEDIERGLFVLFPASQNTTLATSKNDKVRSINKTFFFLRPNSEDRLEQLENLILDTYESMMSFNNPQSKEKS